MSASWPYRYARRTRRMKSSARRRRDLMLACLERAFPDSSMGVRWTRPQGGLFLWMTVPESMDTGALLEAAIKENVVFVPGSAFHPKGGGCNTMRLNFSNATEPMIEEGIARLGRVIAQHLEAQVVPATTRRRIQGEFHR